MKGVDISHWDGFIDWEKLKLNVGFVFMKATEGTTFIDPMLNNYRNHANEHKIPYGFYHFFRPKKSGVEQAEHFIKTIKSSFNQGNLLPVLDWEATNDNNPKRQIIEAKAFLDVVEKEYGKKPIIYTGPSFFQSLKAPEYFAEYPLWVAHYKVKTPWVPKPFTKYLIHQYSETASVPGISGGCDINTLHGVIDDLKL